MHCISRMHLCVQCYFSREISETPTHFATEMEKEKTDIMKRKGDMKGNKNIEKAFIESVISVCSSTSLCYCAPIFRSQSLAGLCGARAGFHPITSGYTTPTMNLCERRTGKSEWNQQGQVYEDGPCNIYVGDSVISAFDWIWRDMNLTARVWLADTEAICYKEIGCTSKSSELLN